MRSTTTMPWVLLDRDGTIIVDQHYQKDPDQTVLTPNAREGLDALRAAGCRLVLVTNQSGIARGLLTEQDMHAVNTRMVELLGGDAHYFAGVYWCPHGPDEDCACRKPRPGMALRAARELGFAPADAWVIGDSTRDAAMGRAAGMHTILLGQPAPDAADYAAADLLDAARRILGSVNVKI